MPDDEGGRPFPDGHEPDDASRGDDEFATVVFDEDFVRAAEIHEPTAVERMLSAAQARAEAEASRRRRATHPTDDDAYEDAEPEAPAGYDPDDPRGLHHAFGHGRDAYAAYADYREYVEYGPYGRYGAAGGPYRGHARWHRPVAWLLAVLMGIGVVALTFTAVYRGASGNRQDPSPPPATTGVDSTSGSSRTSGTGTAGVGSHGTPRMTEPSEDAVPSTASAVPRSP